MIRDQHIPTAYPKLSQYFYRTMSMRRTVISLALLTGAAGAAVLIVRPAIVKDLLRPYYQKWSQPSGPKDTGSPVVSSGTGHSDFISNDPAPYDQPDPIRSAPAILIGDRLIRPNIHFDFEASSDPSWLTSAHAFRGHRSLRMDASIEYGTSIRRRVGDVARPLTAVAVGMWCRTEEPIAKPITIVTTVHRQEKQLAWFGKEFSPSEHVAGTWQRFQGEFLLRDLVPEEGDIVTVYLWNKTQQDLWVDDMDIVFRSNDVLGKPQHPPHDLEHGANTSAPLPFAGVNCMERPDPITLGIRPGAPAPALVEAVAVPGTGFRWRYRPGDGVARLEDDNGVAHYLVRPWCLGLGDLLGFERVHVAAVPDGLLLVGHDVDRGPDNELLVARTPPPIAAVIQLSTP